MRKFFIGGLVLLVAALAAAFVAPFLVPSEVYRERITAEATKALGRPVTIAGEVSVSVLPKVEARASNVSIANPEGWSSADGDAFITMDALRARVALLPLLSRRVEIEEFVLQKPVITMEAKADGSNNWTFASAEAPAKPAASTEGFKRKPGALPGDVALGDVRIVDGSVAFSDAASGASHAVSGLNIAVVAPSLAKPLAVQGDFVLDGEAFNLNLRLDSVKGFLEGAAAPMSLKLSGALVDLALDGGFEPGEAVAFSGGVKANVPSLAKLAAFAKTDLGDAATLVERVSAEGALAYDPSGASIQNAKLLASSALMSLSVDGQGAMTDALSYSGAVVLDVPSVRALAAAVGTTLPEGQVYGPMNVSGTASGGATSVAFDNATVVFDAIRGSGAFRADLSGARPKVTGALAVGDLDVNPYMPASSGGAPAGGGGGIPPWSDAPIDLTPLKLVDADLTLSADSLKAQSFTFGKSKVSAKLVNGKLDIALTDLSAYGGSGTALVTVNARSATPSYSVEATLAGLQAEPFLKDAAGFDRLTGAGNTRIALTSTGASQAAIMRGLNGSGSFNFNDGAIRGVNLAAVTRGVESVLAGNFSADAFGSTQTTDFSELGASFAVKDGVAAVNDFALLSPFVRVAGSGQLDIAGQAVRFGLAPEAVGDATGQGGDRSVKGLAIPLKIEGPWSAVKIGLDQQAVNRLAEQVARGALTGELENALGGDLGGVGDALKSVVGGQGEGAVPGKSLEDVAKEAATKELSRALGLPTAAPAPEGEAAAGETAEGEAPKEGEDPADALIKGLFGD